MSQTFYITTPIYYVNDVPHIGHAYTTIAADVLARYHRLLGHDVFFLTGLDEHGQKVQQAAARAGIDPQAHCDKLAPQFRNLWTKLNISHDAFIRTTDAKHKAIVQQKLQTLFDKQLIYRADYSGWYCTFDERFWTEKDVEGGLCPDCKRPVERLSLTGSLTAGTVVSAFSPASGVLTGLVIPKSVPSIAKIATSTSGGFAGLITFASTSREVTQLRLTFNTSRRNVQLSCGTTPGCSASGSTLTFDVKSMFDAWFQSTSAYGGLSTLRVPLSFKGNVSGSVSVTLVNSIGASTAGSFNLP